MASRQLVFNGEACQPSLRGILLDYRCRTVETFFNFLGQRRNLALFEKQLRLCFLCNTKKQQGTAWPEAPSPLLCFFHSESLLAGQRANELRVGNRSQLEARGPVHLLEEAGQCQLQVALTAQGFDFEVRISKPGAGCLVWSIGLEDSLPHPEYDKAPSPASLHHSMLGQRASVLKGREVAHKHRASSCCPPKRKKLLKPPDTQSRLNAAPPFFWLKDGPCRGTST